MEKAVAIIPARSGSKSVRDKNIRLMNGKPMLAYTIEHALKASKVDRVIVSTDSPVYREIAIKYGAEVPFLRPAEFAQDHSLDIDVFEHALEWLAKNERYYPDICVHLRPTHPIRDPQDIDRMVTMLTENAQLDAVRSVSPAKQIPYKMWLFPDDGSDRIEPVATCSVTEAYNAPRQSLPKAYMQNACIDVVRSRVILDRHSMTGEHIAGYRMDYDFDVDTETEFLSAEKMLALLESLREGHCLKICCDIDGVLASKTPGNNYALAVGMTQNIELLNALYQRGHRIVLFTARGYKTGIDWKETTQEQMRRWGVHYHELLFGKPDADVYIDDKFFDLDMLKKLL